MHPRRQTHQSVQPTRGLVPGRAAALAILLLLASGALGFGCGSVPEYRFVADGDAAVDGGGNGDGGPDAPVDFDSGQPVLSCPNNLPQGAVNCCQGQSTFCAGDCPKNGSGLRDCRDQCEAAGCTVASQQICCRSGGTAKCIPYGGSCP